MATLGTDNARIDCDATGTGPVTLWRWALVICNVPTLFGCTSESDSPSSSYTDIAAIRVHKFADVQSSNVSKMPESVSDQVLIQQDGQEISIGNVAQGKHLVVVITRGLHGTVCPYCATQTSRLITNYEGFRERNTEVIVVLPTTLPGQDKHTFGQFLAVTRTILMDSTHQVPFPMLFDPELRAVGNLGIRASLAKPSTYILDRRRRVRFAYVGQHAADRPTVQSLFDQLDAINEDAAAADAVNEG